VFFLFVSATVLEIKSEIFFSKNNSFFIFVLKQNHKEDGEELTKTDRKMKQKKCFL